MVRGCLPSIPRAVRAIYFFLAFLAFLAFFLGFVGFVLPFGCRVDFKRIGGDRFSGANIFIGGFSMIFPFSSLSRSAF